MNFRTKQFIVHVSCMTYNQADYIRQTLDGFCNQLTNFPYICSVVDDCSTDGEQNVIRDYISTYCDPLSIAFENFEYGQLIFAQHKQNTNFHFAVLLLSNNHYSIKKDRLGYLRDWREKCRYEAWCEGDDYWVSNDKLQMQVDFLDANQEYVLCHTAFNTSEGKIQRLGKNVASRSELDQIITGNHPIGSPTVLLRLSSYFELPKYFFTKDFSMGDLPLWIELSNIGKVKYIDTITATYRVLPNSASHNKDINVELAFRKAALNCRLFYNELYKRNLKKEILQTYFDSCLKLAVGKNNVSIGMKMFSESLESHSVTVKQICFWIMILWRKIIK